MDGNFLSSLANYYYKTYGNTISEICFVFPSRRAGIFFRNHLQSLLGSQPIWSPSIFTINEFIETIEPLPVADNITLLFKLYEAYAQVAPEPISFDEFMPWGDMLLSDFDDIDKYLVNAQQLFSNVVALKEIESDYTFLSDEQIAAIRLFWQSFNPQKLSDHQQSFLKNWAMLFPIYQKFNELLNHSKMAYTGMVMRQLAHKIDQKEMPDLKWKKIVFSGFFVLTPSEQKLFKYLKNSNLADYIWDYSPWMMNRLNSKMVDFMAPFKDAASFLNENLLAFPPPTNWELPQCGEYPSTEIVGVASQTEQLRLVSDFLETTSQNGGSVNSGIKTAIVLADESMLIPVLHSIPPAFNTINVTLGYPLKNTPIFSLIDAVVQLQRNAKTTREGKTWFYFRDVLPIIQHQYILTIDNDNASLIKNNMLGRNSIFVEANDICLGSFFPLIFKKINQTEDIQGYIENIIFSSYKLVKETTQSFFEQEFAFALYKSVVKLQDLLVKVDAGILPDTWLKLFKKLTETQTVAFKGEPLSGLQIMGVMETRAIDFDNLVILNLNEGVFPKDSATNTFIPYNLRKGFGLPTLEHQDAIFSYYFFRLIHRAKNVRLVFSTSSQGGESGEMSRYLYQLIYQHPLNATLTTAVEQVKLYKMPSVYGKKNQEVIEKLKSLATSPQKPLSPSAISGYIECSMRFYFRYILGIKEPESITESIDMRMFGIILHGTMEALYEPFKTSKRILTVDDLEQLAKNQSLIDSTLHQVFKKEFSEISLNHDDFSKLQGKNILVFEVLRKYIKQIILNDIDALPLRIIDLEGRYAMPFKLSEGLEIYIGGIIDRVDETQGVIRVLDYKTGRAKNVVSQIDHLFDSKKHSEIKAIFQTLLYANILSKSYPDRAIEPAILQLKVLYSDSNYSLFWGKNSQKTKIILDDVIEEFNNYLQITLDDLFNPDIDFIQTEDRKKCDYCTYKELCNR